VTARPVRARGCGVRGQVLPGVAVGLSVCVEQSDRQLRVLDVGIVTDGGKDKCWHARAKSADRPDRRLPRAVRPQRFGRT
jgi:hypothetical protein